MLVWRYDYTSFDRDDCRLPACCYEDTRYRFHTLCTLIPNTALNTYCAKSTQHQLACSAFGAPKL